MIASATLNLAARLHDDLLAPRDLRFNGSPTDFIIEGGVRLKGGSAHCSIVIAANWIRHRPDVTCRETWLRAGADWHADSKGSLCYVYDQEWHDVMSRLVETKGALGAFDTARMWIIRNVTWLLNKHLLADQLGITEWPKVWPFWAHEAGASRQYARQRRKTCLPKIM